MRAIMRVCQRCCPIPAKESAALRDSAISTLLQVETTVSNSVLRITGSWIGSTVGFGVMSSAIATNPYGASLHTLWRMIS